MYCRVCACFVCFQGEKKRNRTNQNTKNKSANSKEM